MHFSYSAIYLYQSLGYGGVDLATVRELMRHRTYKMTLWYSHLAPGHKRRMVKIFDNGLVQVCPKKEASESKEIVTR